MLRVKTQHILTKRYELSIMQLIILILVTILDTGAGEGVPLVRVSACRGSQGLPCTRLQMRCSSPGRVFLHSAQYGRKQNSSECLWIASDCLSTRCCERNGDGDACFDDFTDDEMEDVYEKCWNKPSCDKGIHVIKKHRSSCENRTFIADANFAQVQYFCLSESAITNFHSKVALLGPAVAIRYDSTDVNNYVITEGDKQTWHCQVDTPDCIQRQADVILVREGHSRGRMQNSSTLGWTGGDLVARTSNFQLLHAINTTPFIVSVSVGRERRPDTWAVLRGDGLSNLRVQCGYTDADLPSRSSCNGQSGDSGAVVGTVVVVVVIVTLAVLGVVLFLRRRSRQAQTQASKGTPSVSYTASTSADPDTCTSQLRSVLIGLSKSGTSSAPPVPEVKGQDSDKTHNEHNAEADYEKIGEIQTPHDGHPTAPGRHGNPSSPAEDPDYDLLGQQKSQSSSSNPAATYGRLGEVGGGGEDTDYSYDHLARGPQAAPDVNSDYDTAALHVTSEGDYNVAGIPKKQHVITGSEYDVADVATSSNADRDYAPMSNSGNL